MRLDAFAKELFRSRLEKLDEQLEDGHQKADEDAVHDLRVAIRRFSQVLLVFHRLLPAPKVDDVRKKLKRVMKAAGGLRNLDVVLQVIGETTPGKLRKALEARRSKALAKLDRRIARAVKDNWLREWRKSLKFRHSTRDVRTYAADVIGPAEKQFLERGDKSARPETTPAALHRFRIVAKQLRYSMELFEALEEEGFGPRIEAARELQQILGNAHDAVINADLVKEAGGPASLEKRLRAAERRYAEKFQQEWPKIRAAIAKPHPAPPNAAPKRKAKH